MSAGYLELFIEQGESFSANVTLDSLNGSVYNLYDFTAKSEIRKSYWSANTSASFSTSINVELGMVGLGLSANTTQRLSSGKYVYDVFLTHSVNGNRFKVLEGILFVDPSSTKI
jgi:hypothetical protein